MTGHGKFRDLYPAASHAPALSEGEPTRPFPWRVEIVAADDARVVCGQHGNPSTYATIADCHWAPDADYIVRAANEFHRQTRDMELGTVLSEYDRAMSFDGANETERTIRAAARSAIELSFATLTETARKYEMLCRAVNDNSGEGRSREGFKNAADSLQDRLMEAYAQRDVAAAESARLRNEIRAMEKMYTEVTSPLQECCQRHHLGLGGEFVQELVVEEIDRLRATALTPEEADLAYRGGYTQALRKKLDAIRNPA